jgi:hypothetical protein
MSEQTTVQPLREGRNYPSPFQKVLALGYYDGPTEGLLQCVSGSVYRFHLLAWDEATQDLRVFGLAALPSAAFTQLVALYAPTQPPRWPTWVPSWQEGFAEPTEAILAQAGPVEWVLAVEDLYGPILSARAVLPEEVAGITDWGAFLGVARVRGISREGHAS